MDSKTLINGYISLLLLYELLSVMMDSNILLTLIRWTVLLWSLVYFLRVSLNFRRNPAFMNVLTVLIIMFIFYGMQIVIEGKSFIVHDGNGIRDIASFLYLYNICMSLLPIYVFFDFSMRGIITREEVAKRAIIFLLVIAVCSFFKAQALMADKMADETTNNYGYTFLSYLPMLMLLRKYSIKQYTLFAVSLLMILLCMKRGAIFIAIILSAIYYIYLLKGASRKTRVKLLGVAFIFLLMFATAVSMMMSRSGYFQERVEKTEEGDSSGRDAYYLFFIDYLLNKATQEELLVGRGANGTLEIWTNYAHNDWLEIAINQGLLGLFVYLIFWIAFLKLCCRNKLGPGEKAALWMLFVVYFMKTMFSMSYTEYNLYSSIVLGYCIAKSNYRKVPRRLLKLGSK